MSVLEEDREWKEEGTIIKINQRKQSIKISSWCLIAFVQKFHNTYIYVCAVCLKTYFNGYLKVINCDVAD